MTTLFTSIISTVEKVKVFSTGEKSMARHISELPSRSIEFNFKTGLIFKKIIKSETETNTVLCFTRYREIA